MHTTTIASYALPDGSTIVRQRALKGFAGSVQPPLWSVLYMTDCLNNKGQWEHDLLPISHDAAFVSRCRFSSPEQAYQVWANLPENAGHGVQVAQEKPAQLAHYTVVAYRWGWTNDHFYQLCQTPDLRCAIEFANKEADGRAGKYGVAVYEWRNDSDFKLAHYAASSYCEVEPHMNPRIGMFLTIGHRSHEAAVTGCPPPSATTELVGAISEAAAARQTAGAEVPEWLVQVVRRQEHTSRLLCLLQNRAIEQKASASCTRSGQGEALTDPEASSWLDEAHASIEREIDVLMAHRTIKTTGQPLI